MEVYEVEIRGVKPLLLNNPEAEISNTPTRRRGEHMTPEEEAKMRLYINENGEPCVPSKQIKGSLRCAGRGYRVRGRGTTTYGSMIRAGIDIQPFMIPIISKDEWKVDVQHVVVQRNRIPRARPRFDDWKLEFRILNRDPSVLLRDTLKKILIDAGKWCGIGDFRPEYGLFEVTRFEVVR